MPGSDGLEDRSDEFSGGASVVSHDGPPPPSSQIEREDSQRGEKTMKFSVGGGKKTIFWRSCGGRSGEKKKEKKCKHLLLQTTTKTKNMKERKFKNEVKMDIGMLSVSAA